MMHPRHWAKEVCASTMIAAQQRDQDHVRVAPGTSGREQQREDNDLDKVLS